MFLLINLRGGLREACLAQTIGLEVLKPIHFYSS